MRAARIVVLLRRFVRCVSVRLRVSEHASTCGRAYAARLASAALLAVLTLALSACGRIGLELLPLEGFDASVDTTAEAGASSEAATMPIGMCSGAGCTAAGCPGDSTKTNPGVCGCGRSDTADADGDKTPDCVDFCPGAPDTLADDSCGCPAARADADGDGMNNCSELCPFDAKKLVPGACGCGSVDSDSDSDGTADCLDTCPSDPAKTAPGSCGCGVSDQDTDLDGVADCRDLCSGASDRSYQPDTSCGVGYCQSHNVPSSCVAGLETACAPGTALSGGDANCDGIDDDCDGQIDEDFGMASSCGVGACARVGVLSCVAGRAVDSCVAGSAPASTDTSCDGIDDDCDGKQDEDYPTKASTCAAGACASTGTIACSNGKVTDSCAARAPTSTTDATCDNVDDDCNGAIDEDYKSTSSNCGVGACARTGTISCVRGSVVNSCVAGTKTSSTDTTCNDIDDDCNGKVDDGYPVTSTSCGRGACLASGSMTCVAGATRNSCVAKSPTATTDDAFVPGNGIDDDCDGMVDEDVAPCDTTPKAYEAGAYPNIAVPGNCHSVSVRMWGGGGAGGTEIGIARAAGGAGGAGGYVTGSALITGSLSLYVGGGAPSGCNGGGSNAGSSTYAGGSGGSGAGADGADGNAAGGGSGGIPSSGSRGGAGHYGGGGGGAGNGGLGDSGNGGGGGAASVAMINGVRAAVAGGGGGGGGAQGTSILGSIAARGGDGGPGCRGNGQVETSTGGGGGGGGLCIGSATQTGSGATPAASGSLPNGRARGGASSCGAGGGGYAILTFAP